MKVILHSILVLAWLSSCHSDHNALIYKHQANITVTDYERLIDLSDISTLNTYDEFYDRLQEV